MKNLMGILASLLFIFAAVNTSTAQQKGDSNLDLVVTSVAIGYMSPLNLRYSGNEITIPVQIVIQNIGKGDIKNKFGNYIGLKFGNMEIYGIVAQQGLKAGQRSKLSLSLKLPESAMGTSLRFTGVADHSYEVPGFSPVKESNEQNNSKTVFLKIPTFFKIGEDAPVHSPPKGN